MFTVICVTRREQGKFGCVSSEGHGLVQCEIWKPMSVATYNIAGEACYEAAQAGIATLGYDRTREAQNALRGPCMGRYVNLALLAGYVCCGHR